MLNANKTRLSATIFTALLGMTACGGGSSSSDPTPPTNSAPTDISLSAASVDENALGAEVGSLSATDADAGDSFTYTVDDARFEIDGATLKLTAESKLNFEQEASITVNVTVSDSASATFSKDMTIDVNDLLDYYDFPSAIMPGESAVSYSGQIARQLLINDLNQLISSDLGDTSAFDTSGTFTNR